MHDLKFGQKNSRRSFLKDAAIVGSRLGHLITAKGFGQVSCIAKNHTIIKVHFETLEEAYLMASFGWECSMSNRSSILRTAIMLGLKLPRIEEGIMSQTRLHPFTRRERDDIHQQSVNIIKHVNINIKGD